MISGLEFQGKRERVKFCKTIRVFCPLVVAERISESQKNSKKNKINKTKES